MFDRENKTHSTITRMMFRIGSRSNMEESALQREVVGCSRLKEVDRDAVIPQPVREERASPPDSLCKYYPRQTTDHWGPSWVPDGDRWLTWVAPSLLEKTMTPIEKPNTYTGRKSNILIVERVSEDLYLVCDGCAAWGLNRQTFLDFVSMDILRRLFNYVPLIGEIVIYDCHAHADIQTNDRLSLFRFFRPKRSVSPLWPLPFVEMLEDEELPEGWGSKEVDNQNKAIARKYSVNIFRLFSFEPMTQTSIPTTNLMRIADFYVRGTAPVPCRNISYWMTPYSPVLEDTGERKHQESLGRGAFGPLYVVLDDVDLISVVMPCQYGQEMSYGMYMMDAYLPPDPDQPDTAD